MSKVSVNAFKKILREELTEIADENGWDLSKSTGSGYSFQLWCANLLCQYDKGIETDPFIACDGGIYV